MNEPKSLRQGRYVLVDRLGEGGMATVYRAFDQRLQVWRAIKLLLPQYANKKKLMSRFETEAQTMAMLEHPHIVRVYDVDRDGSHAFIVMEIVEGGNLVDWLDRHGPMPPRMAVDVIVEVCQALEYAHARSVIHRDIKPHNVMVDRRGICRLTDFGIARAGDDDHNLTRTGAVMGTWGYMAPEQRTDAKHVDRRADVYSTAATLYSLLTHRIPVDLFAADRDPALLEGVAEALLPVIRRATDYHKDHRYASAQEFAAALLAVRESLPENPLGTPPLTLDRPVPSRPPDAHTEALTQYHRMTLLPADGDPAMGETRVSDGEQDPNKTMRAGPLRTAPPVRTGPPAAETTPPTHALPLPSYVPAPPNAALPVEPIPFGGDATEVVLYPMVDDSQGVGPQRVVGGGGSLGRWIAAAAAVGLVVAASIWSMGQAPARPPHEAPPPTLTGPEPAPAPAVPPAAVETPAVVATPPVVAPTVTAPRPTPTPAPTPVPAPPAVVDPRTATIVEPRPTPPPVVVPRAPDPPANPWEGWGTPSVRASLGKPAWFTVAPPDADRSNPNICSDRKVTLLYRRAGGDTSFMQRKMTMSAGKCVANVEIGDFATGVDWTVSIAGEKGPGGVRTFTPSAP